MEWQDANVVAIQIRGVSEPTRSTLSAEARARGESLQEYLLDVLDREAREIDNRRLFAAWAADPLVTQGQPVDGVERMHSELAGRESQLAGGRSSAD
jgi:hypothetical protein